MYPTYNDPYGMYGNQFNQFNQRTLPQQPQVQNQTQTQYIQSIQKENPETQSVCYFVKSPGEMNSIKVAPFTYYIGINDQNKEIYVRRMKDDGTTSLESYGLVQKSQEKSELQLISERLERIEDKLNNKREILHLKEKKYESSND